MLAVYVFISLYFGNQSLFGQDRSHQWSDIFLFQSANPLAYSGLPLFISFYTHLSLKHLLVNMFLFFVTSKLVEEKCGFLKTTLIALFVHVISLVTISMNTILVGASGNYYSGASLAAIGLLIFYLSSQKKWTRLLLSLVVIGFNFNVFPKQGLFDPHIIAALLGLVFSILWPVTSLRKV